MKRFYRSATAVPQAGGWRIALDGKPVTTPQRRDLVVPTQPLANAIAAEWDAQGDSIDPRMMPLTGIANAAVDHVEGNRHDFAARLAAYAETDLVCYRADMPALLAERQASAWDPLIAFVQQRYDAGLAITTGITHIAQSCDSTRRLADAVKALDAFRLAAMQPVVTIAGSVVIALALLEGRIDAEAAFAAGTLDELFQAEQWGEDEEACLAREARRRDFDAAVRFLSLL
jgi:chaperone required for assembly of F1-ATPase